MIKAMECKIIVVKTLTDDWEPFTVEIPHIYIFSFCVCVFQGKKLSDEGM